MLWLASWFLVGPAWASLWSKDNQHAWSVAPYDSVNRTPEERAQMLKRLGIHRYAYSWRERHLATFEAEIEAMKKHDIDIVAWNFLSIEIDDERARKFLEAFRRHGIHPQIWVMQSPTARPNSFQEWAKYMPPGIVLPPTPEEMQKLPEPERSKVAKAFEQARARFRAESFPKTPGARLALINTEAERIKRIAEVGRKYGCKVALYLHNGWFGQPDNALAIIERLSELGVADIGMVYNFHHARDHDHDDTKDFPALWGRIKAHVVAVTVTGLLFEGKFCYPSQGDAEVEMMRVIQQSGWHGQVGLTAEMGPDAEVVLRNYQLGIDWIAAELAKPGSGGPPPFPATSFPFNVP